MIRRRSSPAFSMKSGSLSTDTDIQPTGAVSLANVWTFALASTSVCTIARIGSAYLRFRPLR